MIEDSAIPVKATRPLTAEEKDAAHHLVSDERYDGAWAWEATRRVLAKAIATIDDLEARNAALLEALAKVAGVIRHRESEEGECLSCGAGKPFADGPHVINHYEHGTSELCQFSHILGRAERLLARQTIAQAEGKAVPNG